MARVGGAHHVLGVPHLLRQLRHCQAAVLLAAARGQGAEAHLEEAKSGVRGGLGSAVQGTHLRMALCTTTPVSCIRQQCNAAPGSCCTALTMKKCRRGKGIRLVASLRRSAFSWPGKRRQQVTPAAGQIHAGSSLQSMALHVLNRAVAVANQLKQHQGVPVNSEAPPTRHDGRDEVVQVTKGGGGQLKGAEANVIQRLVVLPKAQRTRDT